LRSLTQKFCISFQLGMIVVTMSTTHNTASQPGPLVRSRIVHVAVSEAGVGDPHDLLEFPELGQETRKPIVDLRSVGGNCSSG